MSYEKGGKAAAWLRQSIAWPEIDDGHHPADSSRGIKFKNPGGKASGACCAADIVGAVSVTASSSRYDGAPFVELHVEDVMLRIIFAWKPALYPLCTRGCYILFMHGSQRYGACTQGPSSLCTGACFLSLCAQGCHVSTLRYRGWST